MLRVLAFLGLVRPRSGEQRSAVARVIAPGEDSTPTEAVVGLGIGVLLGAVLIVEAFSASWPWVPLLLVLLGGIAVPLCLRAKRRLDRPE